MLDRFNRRNSRPRALNASLVVLFSLQMCAVPVQAQSPQGLSASQLTSVIRESNAKISAHDITVVGNGPAVSVLAEEDEKASEQDLKIDAIFISKALVDTVPGQINSIKVLFSQPGHVGRFLKVNKSEILEYGSGKLSAAQLLSSLFINEVEPEHAPSVQQGPQYERRLILWRRIDKLKLAGTGVKPFEDIFQSIETLAKSGDEANLSEKLSYLESKLSDQEEQVALIKKAARGHGVPALQTAASNAASNSGSGQMSSLSSSQGPGPDSGGLPPNPEGVKQAYMNQVDSVIRQAASRNLDTATKLRSYKSQIEKYFAENQKPKAFYLIKQFQDLALKETGIDIMGPGSSANRQQSSSGTGWGQGASNGNQNGPYGQGPGGQSQNGGPYGGNGMQGQGGGPGPFGQGGGPGPFGQGGGPGPFGQGGGP